MPRPTVTRIAASLVSTLGLGLGLGLAMPAFAHAQRAEAEALFQDGDRLMSAGNLADACAAFEGSNRIEPRAGTLIRLGDCRAKNQQLASAWSAYTDALARVKDPRKRTIAHAAVKALAPRLSKLTIRVSEVAGLAITRNGAAVDEALWNRPVPVDGGRYEIVVAAPGFVARTVVVQVPVEGGDVTAEVPALVRPAPRPTPAPPVPTTTTAPPSKPRRSAPAPGLAMRRKVAIGFAVVGAGSLIAGSVLGVQAQRREDAAFALCPSPRVPCSDAAAAQAKLDDAHTRALYANVMLGASAVVVVGAAVLWFTGAAPVTPAIGRDTVGLAVTGGF